MASDRRRERRERLLAQLDAQGLDAIIVSHLPNVRYLSGFTGSAGLFLASAAGSVLITDSRYEEQAVEEIGGFAAVEIVSRERWARVDAWAASRRHPGSVGFEAHVTTASTAKRFEQQAGRPALRPVSGVVERLREVKDADEVVAVRAAAQLAGEALAATLPHIAVGDREIDVAARLESELRRRGSEWHPFQTIVASGPRSALPHARTSERRLEAGEFLLIDFGAQVDGYCADLTRTMVLGAPASERQREVYEVVRTAHDRAIEAIRPPLTGREADQVARSVFEAAGLDQAVRHSLGHGLGLEIHEAPSVGRHNDDPLRAGSVVTIEPGLYFPGWGGIRIEDDIHVGVDGAELLSDGRTELVELM